MYLNRTQLQEDLFGLVGFHQTDNPAYPTLTSSLLQSRSGRYVQDSYNSLLTIENINQCAKNYAHFNYTAYAGGTTYSKYDKVSSGGIYYEYINATPSSGNAPPNGTYWQVIDWFSDYLIRIYNEGINRTVDGIFNAKKINGQVKSIFNNVRLFSGIGSLRNQELNTGKFCGLKIKLKDHRSLVTIIQKIGHQFNGTLADLDLYLFHSSQQAAIATFQIDHTTANNSQWTTLTANNELRAWSDSYDTGGFFMLGYFQDDLSTVKAIQKDITWDKYMKPCCDPKQQYRSYAPFMDVCGFYFDSSQLNGTSLPDYVEDIHEDYIYNYGLNLELTTKCDVSPILVQQEDLLSEVLNFNIGYLLLQEMANSQRTNLNEKVTVLAKQQLYSEDGVRGKFVDKMNSAMKAVEVDLSGLDEACLSCDDSVSIEINSP